MKDKNGKKMTVISPEYLEKVARKWSKSNLIQAIIATKTSWFLFLSCFALSLCATASFLQGDKIAISASGVLLICAAIVCCVSASILILNTIEKR